MREGTYPPDECLSTASSPKAESWVLCVRMLLWVLQLSRHPTACRLWATGQRGKGKAPSSLPTGCLWGPTNPVQSGFRPLLA